VFSRLWHYLWHPLFRIEISEQQYKDKKSINPILRFPLEKRERYLCVWYKKPTCNIFFEAIYQKNQNNGLHFLIHIAINKKALTF